MILRKWAGFAAALAVLGIAGAANAAPATYTLVSNGIEISYDSTNNSFDLTPWLLPRSTLIAQADTTNLAAATVSGLPGKCVLATTAQVKLNDTTHTIVNPVVYVCASDDGSIAGFYNDTGTTPYLYSAPATPVNLAVSGTSNIPAGQVAVGAATLLIGDTYVLPTVANAVVGFVSANSTVVGPPNTPVFTVAVDSGPAPVPTMTEWAMILLGLLLAGGAAMSIQRRRVTA